MPVMPGPQREREEGAGPQTHPPPFLIGVIDDSDAVTSAENKHCFFSNFSFVFSQKAWRRSGRLKTRGLLHIQVILLDGLEAVQSQVIVGLAEHSDLPRLELLRLRLHKSNFRLVVMMQSTPITRQGSLQSPSA